MPTKTPAPDPYAIVQTGGKQYLLKPGTVLAVERLDGEAGGQVTLSNVLAVHDGQRLTVGRPTVTGAEVVCQLLAQTRAPKVVSYKYKRRKGFHWKKGHRQSVTQLKVVKVVMPHGK